MGALLVLVDADQRRIGINPHYLHKNTNKVRELSVNCYQLSGIRFKPPSETSLLDEGQLAHEREVIRRQARERRVEGNRANEFAHFFSTLGGQRRSTGEENPRTKRGKKRGRLAAPLLVKCS